MQPAHHHAGSHRRGCLALLPARRRLIAFKNEALSSRIIPLSGTPSPLPLYYQPLYSVRKVSRIERNERPSCQRSRGRPRGLRRNFERVSQNRRPVEWAQRRSGKRLGRGSGSPYEPLEAGKASRGSSPALEVLPRGASFPRRRYPKTATQTGSGHY